MRAEARRPIREALEPLDDRNPYAEGLVAWYRMTEGQGLVTRDWAENGHADLSGTIGWSPPDVSWSPSNYTGPAVYTDRSSSSVESGRVRIPPPWTSIVHIAYSSAIDSNGPRIGYGASTGDGYWTPRGVGGHLSNMWYTRRGIADYKLIPAYNVPKDNVMRQIAVLCDGVDVTAWVDGAYVGSFETVGDLAYGRISGGNTTCAIRDHKTYARALSADEIRALHAAPDLPIWRPRRGISLALVAVGGGAVPMIYRAARRRSRTLIPGMVVLP